MTRDEIVARYLAGEKVKRLRDGSSNEQVYRALRKAGVKPGRTRAWWPEVAALSAQGLTTHAIAKRLGRGFAAVQYVVEKLQETRA
jgi:DNA-binding NarL/FixJ family response regulator